MSSERLAIVGPATWDPFIPHFQNALLAYDLCCDVDVYGFDREAQLWAGEAADFEHHPPKGVFVFPESRALFSETVADPQASFPPQQRGRQAAELLVGAIRRVAARHPQVSWVIATVDAMVPGAADAVADPALDPFSVAVDEFNRTLCELVRGQPGWSLFDRRRLTARWGTAVLQDPRFELLARYPGSSRGMKLLAERLAAHWAAACGKMKKVLALDCDNTLWGGIVGEDGVDGIQIGDDGIGRAYAEFQKSLLAMESRGALLVLCSRNDPADVEEVFARRRDMVIPRDRITAVQIAWQAKSVSLRRLSDGLGLALRDFVFVDDNPVEREEVRQALPEVTVAEFPRDPADLPAFGYDLGWRHFYRLSVRDEDRAKTHHYRMRAAFEEESQVRGNHEDFLASLRMEALIAVDSPALVARTAQLTQKTNQFNLTLRRYTEAEIRGLIEDPGCTVFTAALEDRFGKHGWIAVAILKQQAEGTRQRAPGRGQQAEGSRQRAEGRRQAPNSACCLLPAACWSVDTFLVSCRVLGRSFERAFAKACIDQVRSVVPLPVKAKYVPGPRNAQAVSFFDDLGFQIVSESPDGQREYRLPSGPVIAPQAHLVSIRWEKELINV